MMHCHSLSDANDQERGQDYEIAQGRFQAGIPVSGNAGENCVEVTRRLRWTIQINSDYLQDLAQLEGRFVQFLEGRSGGSRGG